MVPAALPVPKLDSIRGKSPNKCLALGPDGAEGTAMSNANDFSTLCSQYIPT